MTIMQHLNGECFSFRRQRPVLGVVICLFFAIPCHGQSPPCPTAILGLEFAGHEWALGFEGKLPPPQLQKAIVDDLRRLLVPSAPQIKIVSNVPDQQFTMCGRVLSSRVAIACNNCPRWRTPPLLRKGRFGYAVPPSLGIHQWTLIVPQGAVKAYQALALHEHLALEVAEFTRRWNAGLIAVNHWSDIVYHLSRDHGGLSQQDLKDYAASLTKYKLRIPSRLDYFDLEDGDNTFACYKTALWDGKTFKTILDDGALCQIRNRWLLPMASSE